MAALELHIKNLKYTKIYTGNEDQTNRRTRLSSLLALFKSKPTPLYDLDIPEGYNSIDYRIFVVLYNFLQPDNTISTVDAARCVITAFPYRYPDLRQLISVCFEIAEQIPYYHPSHLKLVELLGFVGQTAKHFEKPWQKNPTAMGSYSHHRIGEFNRRLADYTMNHISGPGDDDVGPTRYVNYQAFLSLIMDGGFWVPTTGAVLRVMRRTFDESHEKETSSNRDAWIMGAAQWILWSGQSLVKLHLDPVSNIGFIETSPESFEIIRTKPITLDMWHTWTSEFRKAAESDEFGEECREVAKRAADLMEALEKAMLK